MYGHPIFRWTESSAKKFEMKNWLWYFFGKVVNRMAVAGGMIWAFRCEIIEVDGHLYLKTAERSYHPKEKVMDPDDIVSALQNDPTRAVYCRLLGENSTLVRTLWVNRDKSKDKI